MKKGTIGKIFTIIVLLATVITMGKLFTKTSFGADNEEKAIIEGNLDKYINYQLSDGNKGTLVQYSLRTGIEYGEEFFAIKSSTLNVNLNQIDGKYPYDVKVIAKSTKFTNGKTSNMDVNYNYDSTNGNLTINVSNENEDGEPIYNTKPAENDRDEFVIISYYDTFSQEKPVRELSCNVSYNAVLFTDDSRQVSTQGALTKEVTDDFGDLTSVSTTTSDVYNGYMKSNIVNGTNYDTEYTENNEILISNKNAHQKINITEENTFLNTNDICYKSTKILKEDFLNVLGENGSIQILDGNKNVISTIDNSTFGENQEAVVTYNDDVNNIVIETSNIINEGILNIENVKKIKSNISNIEDKDITRKIDVIGINEKQVEVDDENNKGNKILQTIEEEVYRAENENTIEIKDAQTNVELNVDNTEWTNEKQNDVTFDVYLNSTDVKYNLFRNPTIEIKLPSQVEKVILNDSQLIYANGLNLTNAVVKTDKNGNLSIVATIEGAQTKYNENNLDLKTNLKISAKIIINKDIEDANEKINLTYTNENAINKNTEQGNVEKQIKIKSYIENKQENINGENVQTVTNNNETLGDKLEEVAKQQIRENVMPTATQNEIEGLNVAVETTRGEDELNNGDVVYEGEFIKYTVKFVNTTENDINNVKIQATIPEGLTYGELEADYHSYLGKYEYNFDENARQKEINVGTIKAGESVTKFYEVKVNDLADSENEKQVTTNIKTYIGSSEVKNYEISNIVKPAEISSFLGASMDALRDRWNYNLQINNPDNKEITVKLKVPKYFNLQFVVEGDSEGIPLPSDQVMVSNDNVIEFTISGQGTYSVQGTIDSSKVKEDFDISKVELKAYASLSVDGIEYKSNENRIIYEFETVSVTMTSDNEGEEVNYGDSINYHIAITNTGRTNLDDSAYNTVSVKLIDYLPENVNPVSVTYDYYEIVNKETGEISNTKTTKTENIPGQITDANGNKLPNVDLSFIIPYGETINVDIQTTAGYVYETTDIKNSVIVQGDRIKTQTSNIISHTIIGQESDLGGVSQPGGDTDNPGDTNNPGDANNPDDTNNPNNQENPNYQEENYSISGVAWNDKNGDGNRQSDEPLLNGIEIMLVDLKDSSNVKESTTTMNGQYSFKNLEKGQYIVVFKYDTSLYSISAYKKSGVSDSSNSDATSQTITLNGESVDVGVTDILDLSQEQSNIDIGLIEKNGQSLKVDKYISNITLQTNQRTNKYTYENSKLAKIDIKAKEIQGAVVTITYNIVVTNQGSNATTVDEIIDNVPNGLSFSEQGNANWTKESENKLVNRSFINQIIAPGESKQVTLTLTKAMTQDGTGTFTNRAEIDVKDSNTNDNSSSADLIISVSTGAIVYVGLGILGLAILVGIMFVLIKFKVLNIKKLGKISVFLVVFSTLALFQIPNSFADGKTAYFSEIRKCNNGHETIQPEGSDETTVICPVCGAHAYQTPNFTGGPDNGGGQCINHGAYAHTGTYTRYGVEFTGSSENVVSDDISINLRKLNDSIGIKKVDGDYVIGPFSISTSASFGGGYDFYIYDRNGAEIEPGIRKNTCDANGNFIWVGGSATFYIRVPGSYLNNGLSRVKASTTRTGQRHIYTDNYGYELYTYRSDRQNVRTNNVQKTDTVERTEQIYNTESIEWTTFYSTLDIVKADADNINLTLNIKGNLSKDDGSYSKDFSTTNGRVHFDNLVPGNYIITETANNNYGYEAEVNKKIALSIVSGVVQQITLTNEKHTGKLQLSKEDSNTGKKLSNVGFKIKNSNGQYIIAVDEKGQTQTKVTGSITLGNIKTTGDKNSATTFITGNDGLCTINNILTGTYTVEESYIGTADYGYDLDDNYVTWNNGVTSGKGLTSTVEVTRQRSYYTIPSNDIKNDNQKTIEDGVYEIESGVDSRYALDVSYGNSFNKANIALYEKNNRITEKFYVKYLGNGDYNIISLNSNMYVDLDGGVAKNGTNIQIYQNNGLDPQRWKIISVGNGYYKIASKVNTNYCIDVMDGTASNFKNVQIYENNGTNAQKFKFNSSTSESSNIVKLSYKNTKKYVRLSGKVWEDMIDGKTSTRDYTYSDNVDKLVANVTVRLKDRDGNIIPFKNAQGQELKEVLTDSNGYYEMWDVVIDDLNKYYIEFTYNGMSYTNIPIKNVLDANSSKAIENSDTRKEFNNNFAEITYDQGTTGQAKDSRANDTYKLTYDEGNYSSTLNYGPNSVYGYENQRFPINNTEKQYIITSNTRDGYLSQGNNYTGYLSDIYTAQQIRGDSQTAPIEEIKNINLGLVEREQPDLALVEDVYTAKVTLNNYEHTYKYSQRFDNPGTFNESTGLEGGEDGFNVAVKFGNKYGSQSYTREIYSSDIVYNKEPGNEGKLGVYITYKISIKNEATTLRTRANQLVNYFDERYDINSIKTEDGKELQYNVDNGYNSNGYRRVFIDNDETLRAQSQEIIYIEYKLQNDAINAVLNEDLTLNSVTEVTSYSTFSDDNSTPYAGVDKDSRPGSTVPQTKTTYEDDTDSAPSIVLKVKEERVIKGTVWEDNARADLLEDTDVGFDRERKGDGLYTIGENKVGNVLVELLEEDGTTVATLYKFDSSTNNTYTENASMYTSSLGDYEFSGVIPGKYLIRYTYGDQSVIYDSSGNRISNVDISKYKSTIYRGGDKAAAEAMTDYWYRAETGDAQRLSDAKDKIGINDDGSTFDVVADRTTDEEINYATALEEDKLVKIQAETRGFDIKLDYDVNLDNISQYGTELKFVFDNMDLGIIRRPIQDLTVKKEISHVQVVLANGQVIIDGDPRGGNLQYVRFLPDGNIHIEIDNELLQGATINITYAITVDNTSSEIDYNNEDYYIYGIVPPGNSGWKLATVTRLLDYLSNGLTYDEAANSGLWEKFELDSSMIGRYFSEDAYNILKKYNGIFQTDEFANMEPGQVKTVEFKASRLLSNNAEDFNFDNDIEVNTLKNKKIEDSIPGNYVPGDSTTYEKDNDTVNIVITGPTGENRNYLPYVLLGISLFIILATGIIFIKKKVL